MSDHIEIDGKKYYEESYLTLANNNVKRKNAEIERLKAELKMCYECAEQEDAEIERLKAVVDAAFLAGVDHHVISRSRMDMPRDRIGLLRYWKERAALAKLKEST